MGQRQFLLIILATIVISVATVVGVTRFGEAAVTASRDALNRECQTILSRSKGYYRKSIGQGGGGNSFTGLTFARLGMGADDDRYASPGGTFELASTAQTVTCLGTGSEPVHDGHDIQVRLVYFAAGDSIRYQDNRSGGVLHKVPPMRAMASSSMLTY